MKKTLLYLSTPLIILTLAVALPITYAQDYTQSNLLEGAKARFGKGTIRDLTYSPDGNRLAVATAAGIWIYDAHTGDELDVLLGHTERRENVVYSPDGTLLASGGNGGDLRLWDANTGTPLHTLIGHSAAFSPDGTTIAGGGVPKIGLWDADSGELKTAFTAHTSTINSIVFSPDGTTIASGSSDNTVRLWDAASNEHKATLTGHTNSVDSVAFSPDGTLLASGGWDGAIRLWDPVTGVLKVELLSADIVVRSLAFSPDGTLLASGGWDGTIRLWDPITGVLKAELPGHKGWINSVAFSPDGTTLTSGGWDGTIRLWDPVTGEYKSTLITHTGNVTSVVFSSDDATVISGSADGTIRLWDVVNRKQIAIHTRHTNRNTSVVFSPDGTTIASVSGDGTITLWNVINDTQIATLTGHTNWNTSVAFSPDGALLASVSGDGTITLWNVISGAQIATLTGHTYGISCVAVSPDGTTIASGSLDGTVRFWNVASGAQIAATLTRHTNMVESVVFSPDGALLASARTNGEIRIWDATTGEYKAGTKHDGGVRFAFSPDGQTLATPGDFGDEVRLLDAATCTLKAVFPNHTSYLMSFAFSPDGQTLATGSRDGHIILWELTPDILQKPQPKPTGLQQLESELPPTVRTIYVYPNDGSPEPNIDTTLDALIKETQEFYANQMENHGFGRKTFTFEKDANGNAVVHHIQALSATANYINAENNKILEELTNQLDPVRHIYLVVLDASFEGSLKHACGVAKSWGIRAGVGTSEMSDNGRIAVVYAPGASCSNLGTTAHELGHVFGLEHDLGDPNYVMYPFWGEQTPYFSPWAAEWLNVHPFLNPGQPDSNNYTTIEVLSERASRLQFQITDADGIHQAQLLLIEEDVNVPCGTNLVLHNRQGKVLNGSTRTTLEFIATKASTWGRLSVIDVHGTISWKRFWIEPDDGIPEDVNGDGIVNIIDLTIVASRFGQTGGNAADVNGDGIVNIIDLTIVAAAFGNTAAAPALLSLDPEITPTRAEVAQWLSEAEQVNLTDPTARRGILFLRQLLAYLTPKKTALLANYPNPFNPETWIPYQLASAADVAVRIYGVDGSLVRTLSLGHQAIGIYQTRSRAAYWDGKNAVGEAVASGVYFYTLTADDFTATRKMLIRK